MSFYQGRSRAILHPTDFSESSEVAFAHALAIAVKNEAELTILQVAQDEDQDIEWEEFPSVRNTLIRWGYLEPGSQRRDVGKKLGIDVDKRVVFSKNVVDAIVGITEVVGFDLMVLGPREGFQRSIFSKPNASISVAQKAHLPTLFVTAGARSCVDLQTGKTSLSKVLLAVDHEPGPEPAIGKMMTALKNLGGDNPQVTLFHVGREEDFPRFALPTTGNIEWTKVTRQGTPHVEIVKHAEEMEADLIVMVTSGKKQLWDILVGSTLQNVLSKAPCPVFTLPAVTFE